MLRGERTLTLRFLRFGSTAGLSSGLLAEERSVTSDLVLMDPRSPARRRHTCMSSSSQEAALQRETAENNSAGLQKQDVLCFLLVRSNKETKCFHRTRAFIHNHAPHVSPRHRCILNKLKPGVSERPSIVTKNKKHGAE